VFILINFDLMKELYNQPLPDGIIEWIMVRHKNTEVPESVTNVEITVENGIEGDHYKGKSKKRQVTLIQAEHLEIVAKLLNRPEISPKLTRRNIVVKGINLLAFKDMQFKIGTVVLEYTGLCYPCKTMEQNLGKGGLQAMTGHGGITARVVTSGVASTGDRVEHIAGSYRAGKEAKE